MRTDQLPPVVHPPAPTFSDRFPGSKSFVIVPLPLISAADELDLRASDLQLLCALIAWTWPDPNWPQADVPTAWLMRCTGLSRRAVQLTVQRLERHDLPLLRTQLNPGRLYRTYDLTPMIRTLATLQKEATDRRADWRPETAKVQQLRLEETLDPTAPITIQELNRVKRAAARAHRDRQANRARPDEDKRRYRRKP